MRGKKKKGQAQAQANYLGRGKGQTCKKKGRELEGSAQLGKEVKRVQLVSICCWFDPLPIRDLPTPKGWLFKRWRSKDECWTFT